MHLEGSYTQRDIRTEERYEGIYLQRKRTYTRTYITERTYPWKGIYKEDIHVRDIHTEEAYI